MRVRRRNEEEPVVGRRSEEVAQAQWRGGERASRNNNIIFYIEI
jgi:hypothetical protein